MEGKGKKMEIGRKDKKGKTNKDISFQLFNKNKKS